jgi:hypothetical protein
MRKLVSKALTNLMAHFNFLVLKILTLWLSYVELLYLQVVSWKLAQPSRHGASFQHCTFFHLRISWEFCGIMEFLYVLGKCLGR